MSESEASTNSPAAPPETGAGPESAARRVLAARWIRGRRARLVTAGAVVVLVGGSALGVAAAVHDHEEHGDERSSARGIDDEGPDGQRGDRHREGVVVGGGVGVTKQREGGRDGGRKQEGGRDGGRKQQGGRDGGRKQQDGLAQGPAEGRAPAPLPALTAAQAVEKAAAAVADGRVESLQTVTEQGGGAGWQAVVLGPDGVRHLVTVDGATAQITGNTVDDGRAAR